MSAEMNSMDNPLEILSPFTKVTEEIRNIMEKIVHIKRKSADKWKEAVHELQLECMFHFLTLKKLNRMAQIRCKSVKDMTLESKQKLDENNLGLQNLLYEIIHLDREVCNCLQFKSKHEDIALVPVAEFYRTAPKEISNEDETLTDVHSQTLARLDWELESRKRLSNEMKDTLDQKENVYARIKKKRQDLDGLRPCLDSVLSSTLQLQEALGDHITGTRILHENARLLPRPLYVLFFQANALADTCNQDLVVQIEGDTAMAQLVKQHNNKKIVDARGIYSSSRDESDSENEEGEDQDSDRGRRKSVSKAQTTMDYSSSSLGDVSKHPLKILLKIYLKPNDTTSHLCLTFSYYMDLGFISVIPRLELNDVEVADHADILGPACLLHDLRELDNRDLSFSRLLEEQELKESMVRNNELVYGWVQKLAGLETLGDVAMNDMETSNANMRSVIKLIRRRILSRSSLAMQLDKFAHSLVALDAVTTTHLPGISHFNLTDWRAVDYVTLMSTEVTAALKDINLASPGDFCYIAKAKRGSNATVEIAVVIPSRYPDKSPIFRIQLNWRGEHTAENSLNMREIELDVNCRLPKNVVGMFKRNQMLTAQMHRLLSLLDIYVETECAKDDGSNLPSEFAMNKPRQLLVKGRARLQLFTA